MKATQITTNSFDHEPQHGVEQPIVFFDGECVMCNGFVDMLLRIDPAGKIQIAPLQGQTARRYLPLLPAEREAWSIYYQDETYLYQQSEAFIQVCKRLGGPWSALGMIGLIPRFIRDRIYRIIASNRYYLFGRRETCRMPSASDKERFLP